MSYLALLGSLLLASVHVFSERLAFLSTIPRSRWLSLAGGVSVAYVFMHLLPELREHQDAVEESITGGLLERHVYLAALLGLTIFYGLERLVRHDEAQGRPKGGHSLSVFQLHIVSFALYNGLIGYLLVHRVDEGTGPFLVFLTAMALHFVANDHGLRAEHQESYHRFARWLLAGAVLVGWGIGSATAIAPEVLALLFSLLAGGIILNVFKEELPDERQSRFWAFAAGAGAYAVLLLFV